MRTITAPDFATLLECLLAEIESRRVSDPFRTVEIVTPSELSREETRRAVARARGGWLGLEFRTLAGWIARVAAGETAGQRRLEDPGPERLVSGILSRRPAGTGPLARARELPGIARAVTRSLQDLRRASISPERLASSPGVGALRRELAGIWREMESALEEHGLWDRPREEKAAGEVESPDRDVPLLLFGFHDLTGLQRAAVAAASLWRPVSLLVPGPGAPGELAATPLLEWASERGGRLEVADRDPAGPAGATLAETLFGGATILERSEVPIEIGTCPTEGAEVREIARRIRDEVLRSGRSWEDFLIVVPSGGPSPALFRRIFAKASIPMRDGAGVPLSRTESGRRARLLARAIVAPRPGPERESLEFVTGATSEEIDSRLRRARDGRDWKGAVLAFEDAYVRCFGEVPEEISELLELVGLLPGRGSDVAAAVLETLASTRHRPARSPEDPEFAVLLVRAEGARGLARPIVFHCGLVEGAVRRPPREDPLLPDGWRERWNDSHAHLGLSLRLGRETREERLLLFRFALEAASERVTLMWSVRGRSGGEPRNPSSLLQGLAARKNVDLTPDAPVGARRRPLDRLDQDAALFRGPETAGPAELEALHRAGRGASVSRSLEATRLRWAPRSLTSHDGVLSDPRAVEAVERRVRGRVWSPTSLERLLACPFSFLQRHLLELDPARDEDDDLDPAERGRAFHRLFESTFRSLADEELLPLDPERLPRALRLLDGAARRLTRTLSIETPDRQRVRAATIAALRHDVAIALARDAYETRSDRGVPRWFELSFGREGAAVTIELEGGRKLRLGGRADRVDRFADDTLAVVDWKTGAVHANAGELVSREGEHLSVHLQAPLYVEAIGAALGRPVRRIVLDHATFERRYRRIVFTREDLERHRSRMLRVLDHAVRGAEHGWFPCTPGPTCCARRPRTSCGAAVSARFRSKRDAEDLARHLDLLRDLEAREENG